jgi:hypothetical protein
MKISEKHSSINKANTLFAVLSVRSFHLLNKKRSIKINMTLYPRQNNTSMVLCKLRFTGKPQRTVDIASHWKIQVKYTTKLDSTLFFFFFFFFCIAKESQLLIHPYHLFWPARHFKASVYPQQYVISSIGQ